MLAFDVSLPIDAMAGFLARIDAEFARWPNQVTNLVFGHIGDSNLHLAVTTHRHDGLEALCDTVYSAVGAHGGSVSAEHGVGTLRRKYLHHSRGPAELDLMRRLKAALDPHGILNAARVLPDV
jgi:FAD/FMN-containing dehydrogenase